MKRRVKALEAIYKPPKAPRRQIILFQYPGEPPPPRAGKPGYVVVQCDEVHEDI
jgi:hypothetical protein